MGLPLYISCATLALTQRTATLLVSTFNLSDYSLMLNTVLREAKEGWVNSDYETEGCAG